MINFQLSFRLSSKVGFPSHIGNVFKDYIQSTESRVHNATTKICSYSCRVDYNTSLVKLKLQAEHALVFIIMNFLPFYSAIKYILTVVSLLTTSLVVWGKTKS